METAFFDGLKAFVSVYTAAGNVILTLPFSLCHLIYLFEFGVACALF